MIGLTRVYQFLTQTRWTLGFIDFDADRILDPAARLDVRWLRNNPLHGWFADPFILSADDKKIIVLVEEFVYGRRGRISKVVIDRSTMRYERIVPLISIPTHLSFPAWFVNNGKIYIYPESSQSGKLSLYEYSPSSERAEYVMDISTLPLVDAAIFEIDGKKYMSATLPPEDNGRKLELRPFVNGRCDDRDEVVVRMVFDDYVGRNAGQAFCVGNRTFRPAQQCRKTYGEGVVLQEFIVENGQLGVQEIRRLYSDNRKYKLGLHTFNVFDGRLVVVDARGYRFPVLAKVLKSLVRITK